MDAVLRVWPEWLPCFQDVGNGSQVFALSSFGYRGEQHAWGTNSLCQERVALGGRGAGLGGFLALNSLQKGESHP